MNTSFCEHFTEHMDEIEEMRKNMGGHELK